MGVLIGTKDIVGTTLETTWNSGSTLIHASSEVDDDLAVTAKNAVEGAIEGSKAIGVDTSEAASAAATSALKAAGDISASAGKHVRDADTGAIG